jgi:hypothetical protein
MRLVDNVRSCCCQCSHASSHQSPAKHEYAVRFLNACASLMLLTAANEGSAATNVIFVTRFAFVSYYDDCQGRQETWIRLKPTLCRPYSWHRFRSCSTKAYARPLMSDVNVSERGGILLDPFDERQCSPTPPLYERLQNNSYHKAMHYSFTSYSRKLEGRLPERHLSTLEEKDDVYRWSLEMLLRKLDDKNATYLPTSSRSDLESLYIATLSKADRASNTVHTIESSKSQISGCPQAQLRHNFSSWPLDALLQSLNDANVLFHPSATRLELVHLLGSIQNYQLQPLSLVSHIIYNRTFTDTTPRMHSDTKSSEVVTDFPMQQRELSNTDRSKIRRKQMATRRIYNGYQHNHSGPWTEKWDTVRAQAAGGFSRATFATKSLSRKISDWLHTDENGIRNVPFQYVSSTQPQQTPHDVSATIAERKSNRSNVSSQNMKRNAGYASRRSRVGPNLRNSARVSRNERSRYSNDVKGVQSSRGNNPFESSPISSTVNISMKNETNDSSSPPHRENLSRQQMSLEECDLGFVDRVGCFITDAVDRVMYPDEEDSNEDVNVVQPRRTIISDTLNASGHCDTADDSMAQNSVRHWKDRMEEQFDRVLGIYSDNGSHDYRRWTRKAQQDDDRRKSHVHVKRGNRRSTFEDLGWNQHYSQAKAGSNRKHLNTSRGTKPFWNEEGNLISLLFGRSASGDSLFFEKMLDHDSGSMVNLLHVVSKTFLVVFGYMCRWASVKGAIPQPIVVLSVTSAWLCTRPRHRFRNVLVTLVGLRTIGEIIHGYVYGSLDWDVRNRSPDND